MKLHYNSAMAMLDIFFNLMLVFFTLFSVTLIKMNPKKKQAESPKSKVEFVISVEWPQNINNDVDTYLEDPVNHLVFYQRREDGLMHLDRDDYGNTTDKIRTPFGEISYKENREIVSIRGIIPGEYTLNVHMYTQRTPGKTPITVMIEKINPYSIQFVKEVFLEGNGDEKTVCRFVLDKQGKITSFNELEKFFTGHASNGTP